LRLPERGKDPQGLLVAKNWSLGRAALSGHRVESAA